MSEEIRDDKLVELKYELIDRKTGQTLSTVEYPLSYVHGHNDILMPEIMRELEGRGAGEVIEIEMNGDDIFGPRDESLVFTDRIENVPEEYRKLGTQILMENDKGEVKTFYVTRMDEETLTIDGNSPFSGRELLFRLEILSVRDATEEEIEAGTALGAQPDLEDGGGVDGARMVPLK